MGTEDDDAKFALGFGGVEEGSGENEGEEDAQHGEGTSSTVWLFNWSEWISWPTLAGQMLDGDSMVHRLLHWRRLAGLFVPGLLLVSGCSVVPELGGVLDRGDTHGRSIVVSLSQQRAYLYQYGQMVAVSPISSGREGKATPVGRFTVIQKSPEHRSSLYGNYVRGGQVVVENVDVRKGGRPPGSRFEGVPMPYFMRFTGAYGLHAGNVPGYPASSGCVRLPPRHAKRFFNAVRIGTPVIIQR